jgi:predicted amidohydrolase YtcJ
LKHALTVLAGLAVLCGCGPAAQPGTTLVTGATLLSVDPERQPPTPITVQRALLIQDGRIAAIGPEDRLRARNPGARLLDYSGRTIVPGFTDAYSRIDGRVLSHAPVTLGGAASLDILPTRTALRAAPDAAWIIGYGLEEALLVSASRSELEALDEALEARPTLILSRTGGAAFANSAALEAAGNQNDTPDPAGGRIDRVRDGAATGLLLGTARELVLQALPQPDPSVRADALEEHLVAMRVTGVTSVHLTEVSGDDLIALQSLNEQNRLPLRVSVFLDARDEVLADKWLERGPDRSGRLSVIGFSLVRDGTLAARTAQMVAPYSDEPDAEPLLRDTLERAERLMERAREAGFELVVKASGDAATDQLLGAMERRGVTDGAPAVRLAGADVVRRDFFDRASALGLSVTALPADLPRDPSGDLSDALQARVGTRRIRRTRAWSDMVGAGIVVTSGSGDSGQTPLQMMRDMTQRDGRQADLALSRDEALQALTRDLDGGNGQGRFEIGQRADFVVLSGNPLSARTLGDIRVEDVFVDGVLDLAPELDPERATNPAAPASTEARAAVRPLPR